MPVGHQQVCRSGPCTPGTRGCKEAALNQPRPTSACLVAAVGCRHANFCNGGGWDWHGHILTECIPAAPGVAGAANMHTQTAAQVAAASICAANQATRHWLKDQRIKGLPQCHMHLTDTSCITSAGCSSPACYCSGGMLVCQLPGLRRHAACNMYKQPAS